MKLIDINGAYIQTQFQVSNVIWNLIGTECIPHSVNTYRLNKEQHREHILVTTRDFFKTSEGKYEEFMRYTVDVKFNQGEFKLIKSK